VFFSFDWITIQRGVVVVVVVVVVVLCPGVHTWRFRQENHHPHRGTPAEIIALYSKSLTLNST